MGNAKIRYANNTSGVSGTYIIQGLLTLNQSLSQKSISMPFPFRSFEDNVIGNVFGQKMTLKGSFLIQDRDDDYTDGDNQGTSYGSESTRTPEFQRQWLLTDIPGDLKYGIFFPLGHHEITDHNGNTWNGRLTKMDIEQVSDEPLILNASFEFEFGKVPLDGQFDVLS